MRKFFRTLFAVSAAILVAGYLIPERKAMPCCTPAHVHYGIVTPIPYVWKAFDSASPHLS